MVYNIYANYLDEKREQKIKSDGRSITLLGDKLYSQKYEFLKKTLEITIL